ncbi:MAG: hypothetical protein R2810_03950 [Flavobacteriales bacterium]
MRRMLEVMTAMPAVVVEHRWLPLGQHDQSAAGGVEARVHAAGDLFAAGQRQAHVRVVRHAIGAQGVAQGLADGGIFRHAFEGERVGRGAQAVQVAGEHQHAFGVHAQAFPHGIAALHHAVEHGDLRLFAGQQFAVHVHLDVGIARIELLEHGSGDDGVALEGFVVRQGFLV